MIHNHYTNTTQQISPVRITCTLVDRPCPKIYIWIFVGFSGQIYEAAEPSKRWLFVSCYRKWINSVQKHHFCWWILRNSGVSLLDLIHRNYLGHHELLRTARNELPRTMWSDAKSFQITRDQWGIFSRGLRVISVDLECEPELLRTSPCPGKFVISRTGEVPRKFWDHFLAVKCI